MLVLTRRIGEKVLIDGNIEITIVSATEQHVRLGVKAPLNTKIYRQELYERILRRNLQP